MRRLGCSVSSALSLCLSVSLLFFYFGEEMSGGKRELYMRNLVVEEDDVLFLCFFGGRNQIYREEKRGWGGLI